MSSWAKSKFCWVERSETMQNQGAKRRRDLVPSCNMPYNHNDSFIKIHYTSRGISKTVSRFRFGKPRAFARSRYALDPQKFDFGLHPSLRMTHYRMFALYFQIIICRTLQTRKTEVFSRRFAESDGYVHTRPTWMPKASSPRGLPRKH